MEFKLPDIGEGVHEGEIVKWLVKAGDTIEVDQPMVEVMTDKATVEIPSPVAGTVEALFAKEGDTVEVGKAIVRIAEAGKAASGPAPAASAVATAPKAEAKAAPAAKTAALATATAARAQESGAAGRGSATVAFAEEPELPFHVLATPATRKLARELNVSLRSVTGTGPHGRITKDDVHAAASNGGARATGTAAAREPMAPPTGAAPRRETPIVARGELKRIPLRGIRRKIAEAMAHAKHTAAHFTYVEEVDMTAIVKLRASAAEEAKKKGIKLTFLPFILKALVPTLKEFPYLNSSLDDATQEIVLKGDYNIGIATDTPQGLMVPVVKGVDQKSVWELAQEIAELTERARLGKSTREELIGGTFTVTNAGSIGGVFATPVINHPEVAILGVNAIRKRPVVVDDQIVIRDMMFLSMSVDHRIVDGADAARFMNRLVYFLSEPTRLVFA
jgi:pyruvate dehydrogenase E2 component (dihydrolipoamide acetyltransferase)